MLNFANGDLKMSSVSCEPLHSETALSEADKQRIRAHPKELLGSEPFVGSRRRQAFLRYVVEESLAGRGSNIKETNIAVDVFGRSDFDAQSSSIVRVTGGEVRKRLTQAYSMGLGQDLRIELPPGGYQPSFYFAVQPTDAPEPDPESGAVQAVSKPLHRRSQMVILAAISLGLLALARASVQFLGVFRPSSPLDLLWRPFLDQDRPVLISIATPILLKLNPMHQQKWLPLDSSKAIPASELVVLRNSYVGTGGAMGAARFAEQLTRRKQRFDLKFGSDANFADLKASPAILIGVSPLSQQLTRGTRFHLQVVTEGMRILGSKKEDRVWERARLNYASPPHADGYALITRLIHSDSGHAVLVIASMHPYTSQAAVEFLTRDDSFRQFTDSAPSDWSTKNFQVVLHNTIYGNSAGSLEVVASEVW
jgi:hypothetical protein